MAFLEIEPCGDEKVKSGGTRDRIQRGWVERSDAIGDDHHTFGMKPRNEVVAVGLREGYVDVDLGEAVTLEGLAREGDQPMVWSVEKFVAP